MHIPRIGQEVVVDFLEGDPDRPIITGRVYDGANMPPYALAANATRSVLRSHSTKGGGPNNFNELSFEDKIGAEQVYLQAEKDMQILVKNDEAREVKHDRTKKIGHDETVEVGNNRSEHVTKDETHQHRPEPHRVGRQGRDDLDHRRPHRDRRQGRDDLDHREADGERRQGRKSSPSAASRPSSIGKDQSIDVGGAADAERVSKDDTRHHRRQEHGQRLQGSDRSTSARS